MRTSELTGAALDWAVAKCEGYTDWCAETEKLLPPRRVYGWVDLCDLNYSTDWAQGGFIIEREEISVERRKPCMKDEQWGAKGWKAMQNFHTGPTPLIAAMRCYVASNLGDEVDVPEELA